MTPTLTDTPDATHRADADQAAGPWAWRGPTPEEAHAEWLRYNQTPMAVIDPDLSHYGQFVAFFDGRPWGYDHDPTALRERVSAEFGIHPDRIFISYLG